MDAMSAAVKYINKAGFGGDCWRVDYAEWLNDRAEASVMIRGSVRALCQSRATYRIMWFEQAGEVIAMSCDAAPRHSITGCW